MEGAEEEESIQMRIYISEKSQNNISHDLTDGKCQLQLDGNECAHAHVRRKHVLSGQKGIICTCDFILLDYICNLTICVFLCGDLPVNQIEHK